MNVNGPGSDYSQTQKSHNAEPKVCPFFGASFSSERLRGSGRKILRYHQQAGNRLYCTGTGTVRSLADLRLVPVDQQEVKLAGKWSRIAEREKERQLKRVPANNLLRFAQDQQVEH